jgi:DNA end-binding protein Ku
MPTRPFWKGYLKLSLVTCPVSMTPATTENAKVRFHVMNRATGNRVVSRYVDAVNGAEVDEDDLAKGYEKAEGDFILFDDEELDALALESARTIDIDSFAPADSVDWIWYDRAHYLAPDDKVGEEAFAVIRDAMKATATIGLSRLVLYRRERPVMLKPCAKGLVLWTLRYRDEVRDPKAYFEGIDEGKPKAEALGLIKELIDKQNTSWSADLARDPTQENLLALIQAKQKGRKRSVPKPSPEPQSAPDNVVNIMDALRKSLKVDAKGSRPR